MPRENASTSARLERPYTKFLEWSSPDKCLKYYDKEKKENILVPMPTKFAIVKQFATLAGFSDRLSSGMYANELPFIKKDSVLNLSSMKVNEAKKPIFEKSGTYAELKGVEGAKFSKVVYALLDGELVRILLKGSALTNWIGANRTDEEIKKGGDGKIDSPENQKNRHDKFVAIVGVEAKKKGGTKYNEPIYTFEEEMSKEVTKEVDRLHDLLVAFKNIPEAEAVRGEISHEEDAFIQEQLDQDPPF